MVKALRTQVPWLLGLAILALLYNRLPLASQPTPAETTWQGLLGDQPVEATVWREPEGERLTVAGELLTSLMATWIPVDAGGVILERDLRLEDGIWRSGPLILAAERWQLLLSGEAPDGSRHLVTSDWVRHADGALRPVGVEPEPIGRVIGWANRWGPPTLSVGLVVLSAGWLLQLTRGIFRKQPMAG